MDRMGKSSAGGRFRDCSMTGFVGDDGLVLCGVYVRCHFEEALEQDGVEATGDALFFDCTPASLNNAVRGQVLARWPEAFDDDQNNEGPGRSRDDILVEDADFLIYITERFARGGATPSGPLDFGGVYVRCDFRNVPFTIRPMAGALFYACEGITNNASCEQVLALHPNARV